jgi:hypothetical protein
MFACDIMTPEIASKSEAGSKQFMTGDTACYEPPLQR